MIRLLQNTPDHVRTARRTNALAFAERRDPRLHAAHDVRPGRTPHATTPPPSAGLHALLTSAVDPAARERGFAELLRLLGVLVRGRMGRRLRHRRDPEDICQSIACALARDLGRGLIRFESEAAVVAYLHTLVRSTLAREARHDRAAKRGGNVDHVEYERAAHAPTAHHQAAPDFAPRFDEALLRARDRLSHDEQEIARLRLAGLDWDAIAHRLGTDPRTLRKRWSRLAERLALSLDA